MPYKQMLPYNNGAAWNRPETAIGWRWSTQQRSKKTIATATISTTQLSGTTRRTDKMARLEAALFVANGAVSVKQLVQWATLVDPKETLQLIDELNIAYDRIDSSFRIERVATGYQLLTRSRYAEWLNRIHHRQTALQLSAPAMETLTIIAYCQPMKRVDIEAIRGVQSAEMIKQLMERELVRIGGEEDSLGRPYLYETTRLFLEHFGLKSLNDLPMADTLRPQKTSQKIAVEPPTTDEQQAA